ncbi:hypothetical protein K1719_011902 [Acacia pycnantha]|nr:hypothetical protein K1719_011902 [Acacia pycnantha]
MMSSDPLESGSQAAQLVTDIRKRKGLRQRANQLDELWMHVLVLADDGLSEYTPVYFYVVKGSDGNLKTSFCSDQSRKKLMKMFLALLAFKIFAAEQVDVAIMDVGLGGKYDAKILLPSII